MGTRYNALWDAVRAGVPLVRIIEHLVLGIYKTYLLYCSIPKASLGLCLQSESILLMLLFSVFSPDATSLIWNKPHASSLIYSKARKLSVSTISPFQPDFHAHNSTDITPMSSRWLLSIHLCLLQSLCFPQLQTLHPQWLLRTASECSFSRRMRGPNSVLVCPFSRPRLSQLNSGFQPCSSADDCHTHILDPILSLQLQTCEYSNIFPLWIRKSSSYLKSRSRETLL